MDYNNILTTLLEIWDIFSNGLSLVYSTLTTKFVDLFSLDIPIVSNILDFVVDKLGIGAYNLITVMFGFGLPLLVSLTLIKWFIGIVT